MQLMKSQGIDPTKKLTEEDRKKLLDQMPPELREKALAIDRAMADVSAICKAIAPPEDDPDRPISMHAAVMGFAAVPSLGALGQH
eukprot:CAMPEP_0206165352 /NCGR_PEP_ID=MMETSP1474-20131121/20086_1 /ASSEMBLY_ACC=CAM_ASM_001110 /TAXON_ID=97495 /ORGANISM="Imantonia sp., Strain RCC918" /LENGTH=84 /DNA_ID=CAMNT_0053568683 /DNA_START=1 /DNA_END=252 /DNA_ORIENTATION=-